jgi:rRNA processing protein Krr1/Pno1
LPFGDFAIMGNPPQLKIVQRKNNCLIQGGRVAVQMYSFLWNKKKKKKKSPHLKIKKKVGGVITKKPA